MISDFINTETDKWTLVRRPLMILKITFDKNLYVDLVQADPMRPFKVIFSRKYIEFRF